MLSTEKPSAMLLDLRMPDLDGIGTLVETRKREPHLPVIIVSGRGDIQTAVDAMRYGAYDFITKPPDFDRLTATLQRALEKRDLEKRVTSLHAAVETSIESVLGRSAAMRKVIEAIHHLRYGFEYIARSYSVWKEPLGVRNRTMAKNLAHKTIVEDSSRCSVASADYLLAFRKKGVNPVPIKHPVGLLSYAGEREIPHDLISYRGWKGNQIENRFSHWIWRQYASAFWDDTRIDRVLPFKESKDEDDEKHVHPLQLDVIERAIVLWSNEDETVLTPFMGVGSEVYGAIINNRKGVGIELKPSYYKQALKNLEQAKTIKPKQEGLFGHYITQHYRCVRASPGAPNGTLQLP